MTWTPEVILQCIDEDVYRGEGIIGNQLDKKMEDEVSTVFRQGLL